MERIYCHSLDSIEMICSLNVCWNSPVQPFTGCVVSCVLCLFVGSLVDFNDCFSLTNNHVCSVFPFLPESTMVNCSFIWNYPFYLSFQMYWHKDVHKALLLLFQYPIHCASYFTTLAFLWSVPSLLFSRELSVLFI